MRRSRRKLLGAAVAGLMYSPWLLFADDADEERPKFFPITPQPTDDPRRVEVREFFYFGCGACYAFEPYLREWEANKDSDVLLVRTPALRTTRWIPLTMVYFTLLKLGAEARLHQEVFDAYHFDNTDLADLDTFADWAATKGLERDAVRTTFKSREVAMALELTQRATRQYGVQGVPTLIVDGRYLTSPSLAGGQKEAIALVDELVRRRREERAQPS